jgi:hypothetical protein
MNPSAVTRVYFTVGPSYPRYASDIMKSSGFFRHHVETLRSFLLVSLLAVPAWAAATKQDHRQDRRRSLGRVVST